MGGIESQIGSLVDMRSQRALTTLYPYLAGVALFECATGVALLE